MAFSESTMRILQVVPRYAPAWAFGGGVQATYQLAREWVRHGHCVTVFTSDQRDRDSQFEQLEEVFDGIRIHRFRNPSQHLASRYPHLCFYPAGLKSALRNITDRFDVVHVAEARGPHNRWVARFVPPQCIPIVWSAYGGLASGIGLRRAYRRLHDRVHDTPAVVRSAAALVAQTGHEAEVYEAFGASRTKIRQIPLSFDWSEFEDLPDRGAFRRELGVTEQERLVTFVGRLHETKGLQMLIPAFSEVVKQVGNSRLAIVGWDQGYAAAARRLVANYGLHDRVQFVDARLGGRRIQVYRDSDLFVLTPGVYEETSLAALEACASGTACVLTRQCEIPGLDAAGAGLTVSYDRIAIASAIIQILNEGAQARMGGLARALVLASFTSAVVAAQHVALFEEVRDETGVGRC